MNIFCHKCRANKPCTWPDQLKTKPLGEILCDDCTRNQLLANLLIEREMPKVMVIPLPPITTTIATTDGTFQVLSNPVERETRKT